MFMFVTEGEESSNIEQKWEPILCDASYYSHRSKYQANLYHSMHEKKASSCPESSIFNKIGNGSFVLDTFLMI
ncbi:hypothetical protein Lalb_Chr18g0051421 [Lupinus albus]|uniref:Uncharacterized protein n=1 Tax=Lupinus albus TaxID=3870 RepID=A0A6A4P216_LUPAL|nr:hypothetical protein Lalb_Chr18g0051421 [Lupinus albus]